jgi:very-short-patch-repair endonuclease
MSSQSNLHQDAPSINFELARSLRKNSTEAEKVLWEKIRNRRFVNHKFRRQHPLGPFIADFYRHLAKLVVEIDGEVHLAKEAQEYDVMRNRSMKDQGITVLRFTIEAVKNNIELVLDTIGEYLVQGDSWNKQ